MSITTAPRWRERSRSRPRDRFVRTSLVAFGVLIVGGIVSSSLDVADWFSDRRLRNLERFLGELRPFPLQGTAWDWGVAAQWAGDLLTSRGLAAAVATLAIAVLAMTLAGAAGAAFAPLAARNLATPEPFDDPDGPSGSPRAHRLFWRCTVLATRTLFTVSRALPEYVLAFLLVGIVGPTAWPIVLALAIHNFGIVGRLSAELIENVEAKPFATLRGIGASRTQLAVAALAPTLLPRFLLFWFYRWESCVREATVLGMLGVASLGYWIQDARTRGQTDTFAFYVLLGSLLVLVGDLLSAVARRAAR